MERHRASAPLGSGSGGLTGGNYMLMRTDANVIDDPFRMIGTEKLLISARNGDKINAMTASWGEIGILWGMPVLSVFVRPQRYTFEFLERAEYFTVSVLGSGHEEAYRICGTRSGRDCDKLALASLHPIFMGEAVTFEEATKAFLCRTVYKQDIDPNGFTDRSLERHYSSHDYHRLYCAEIKDVFVAE